MSVTCNCGHDYDEHADDNGCHGACQVVGCECDRFVAEDYEDADTRADQAYYDHLYDQEDE